MVSVLTLDASVSPTGRCGFRSCHGIWADSRGDLSSSCVQDRGVAGAAW
jgi:hypothetical protein